MSEFLKERRGLCRNCHFEINGICTAENQPIRVRDNSNFDCNLVEYLDSNGRKRMKYIPKGTSIWKTNPPSG